MCVNAHMCVYAPFLGRRSKPIKTDTTYIKIYKDFIKSYNRPPIKFIRERTSEPADVERAFPRIPAWSRPHVHSPHAVARRSSPTSPGSTLWVKIRRIGRNGGACALGLQHGESVLRTQGPSGPAKPVVPCQSLPWFPRPPPAMARMLLLGQDDRTGLGWSTINWLIVPTPEDPRRGWRMQAIEDLRPPIMD